MIDLLKIALIGRKTDRVVGKVLITDSHPSNVPILQGRPVDNLL